MSFSNNQSFVLPFSRTPKVAKRKFAPTQKQPPMEQQPQEVQTPKRPKVDPDPLYEEEEQEEDEDVQYFNDVYMDGDNGGENEDEDEEDDNVEDANEDEEVTGSVQAFHGRIAATIRGSRNSTIYVIGDYLYIKDHDRGKMLEARCRNWKKTCRARVNLDPDTLRVIKLKRKHTCAKDPGLKDQIQMETEMKELAETTEESFRGIFNAVCVKNPLIAPRISFDKMCAIMNQRRKTAITSLMA